MSKRPYVVCVTPSYNRHQFLDNLIYQYQYQDYPKDRIEYIILDDTPGEPFSSEAMKKEKRLTYIHEKEKLLIPHKRNKLNKLALDKGADIIVYMDDDDYYPPDRVKHAVTKLQSSRALIAASTELYIYDMISKSVFKVGPYHANHGTAGTFAFKKEYLANHYFNEDTTINTGEEKFFTNDFTEPMVQLNPWSVILCFNTGINTFDKRKILDDTKKKQVNIKQLIKDKKIRKFFMDINDNTEYLALPEKSTKKIQVTNRQLEFLNEYKTLPENKQVSLFKSIHNNKPLSEEDTDKLKMLDLLINKKIIL